MGVGNRIRGPWLQWPWVDVVLPAAAIAVWVGVGLPVPPDTSRGALYTATSAASGIGLAGAAFVCTIFYQASSELLMEIRERFGPLIRSNWVWILSSLLVAVVLPVLAIVVDPAFPRVATAMVMSAGLVFVTSFTRVIYWFHRTLGILDSPSAKPIQVRQQNTRQ